MFKVQQGLKNKFNIKLTDDIPLESVKARIFLKPIVFEAKHLSNQTKKYQVRLQDDKLILNGQFYTIDSLDKLPEELQPKRVFTPVRDGKTAFSTKHLPFSNHIYAPFKIEGKGFVCVEQYLMYAKATLFGDEKQAQNIMNSVAPVLQKR